MSYPLIVSTLREFGLITEEHEQRALAEWDDAMAQERWWWDLAAIAERQYRGWWGRNFGIHFHWRRRWLDSVRSS